MIWALVAAAIAYGAGVARLRRRGIEWPPGRSLAWYAGVATAAAAGIGHHDFRAHMSAHLLLGMAAPILLVLARPVTLLLRALPVLPARRVALVLRTPAIRLLTHPVTAAMLDAGGLWLLYTTDLYAQSMARPWLDTLVQAHMLLAGGLLTNAIIGRDPAPHRPGPLTRGLVFLAFVAAHGILAKYLYGHPPPGATPDDAQIMYYGGDLLHLIVIVLFFRRVFAAPTGEPGRHATRHPDPAVADRPGRRRHVRGRLG